jgi:hypothetical protein
MAVAGYFLMAPSAMLLVLTGIVSAKAQREPSSDRDLVLFCGSIVGLMLGFIMIALADEISNSQFWATSSGLIRAPGERLESACAVKRRRFPVGARPTRRNRSSRKQSEQSWR